VSEEAVEFALNAAPTKPAQASDQLGQGQLARTREGAGMFWVASQGGKSRAMKMFCQIQQNALDGVRTWAQHVCLHRGDPPVNLQLSSLVGLSSVDWARRGFVDVVKELEQRFPDPATIEKETDKKAFAKLFGEYLRVENVLQNYDEFASLKALQSIDMDDPAAVDEFKAKHYLDDGALATLQEIHVPSERKIQDYRSTYNDVRDWLRREKSSTEKEKSTVDWNDVVFEVDLLKSQEINLDYIQGLIFENNKNVKNKAALVEDMRRVIRASLGNRAKESLLVDFINQTDLDQIGDKASVIEAFFAFAQAEQQREAQELISTENLNADAAKRYISTSLKREFASDNGTELNALLPKMSPLNPLYLTKKQSVFQKIAAFVEKFKGVGGRI
jgi:type I restriction enzyme R subunit